MSASLQGRTIVMSGGSRGIGLAILIAAAKAGANSVLLAKTDQPDPRLPGTVHTAVQEIEAAGGKAVAVVGDVREEADVDARGVDRGGALRRGRHRDQQRFGAEPHGDPGAEPQALRPHAADQLKGTFQLTRAALPQLFESEDPQVVTLGPPINLAPEWLGRFPSYALSKYGMTLLTLGFAAEFADRGVRANCLWPQTTISTAAVANLLGGDEASRRARSPEIMGDAAVALLTDAQRPTGEVFLDVEALRRAGVTDLSPYGGGEELELDFFVDEF